MAVTAVRSKAESAIQYAHQAERLSLLPYDQQHDDSRATTAVEAKFITPQDAVIETASGERLPTVPMSEAYKLNQLKKKVELTESSEARRRDGRRSQHTSLEQQERGGNGEVGAKLGTAILPSRTNPLFPPMPLYGPPTFMQNLHCSMFQISSSILSLAFLAVIVLGAAFTSLPLMFRHIGLRLSLRNPDARRPFYEEEERRREKREEVAKEWAHKRWRRNSAAKAGDTSEEDTGHEEYEPLEGGKDPLVCDLGYYARRVGLDVEEFKVQTEDGFIISLWHVYNPKEYKPVSAERRTYRKPEVFLSHHVADSRENGISGSQYKDGNRKYPVLLVHGLLQSAGAYCANDDDSLAFYLCKSGYDVWLGNNRCGFNPEHHLLKPSDPRMWAWNICQMGIMDLPAFISRVLSETGFEKLGLICHSQGTTETFVALAKEQRPDLGNKISVFCALAPAVYAGPLIGKMYFKFMRVISPAMFRIFFGIHSFIPFMMTMHAILPGKLYGALGYRVFAFLFNWTDDRWDRGLRDRLFQFSPVYVSAESMRWWLGRECFAKQKCILATREEGMHEEEEDDEDEDNSQNTDHALGEVSKNNHHPHPDKGRTAWYDEKVPPMAFWVAGSDDLVDGRRLLRHLEKGHEPHVRVVHSKVIEEYEHLDVIWAMDSIQKVGREVKDVIWQTAAKEAQRLCRIPKGCN